VVVRVESRPQILFGVIPSGAGFQAERGISLFSGLTRMPNCTTTSRFQTTTSATGPMIILPYASGSQCDIARSQVKSHQSYDRNCSCCRNFSWSGCGRIACLGVFQQFGSWNAQQTLVGDLGTHISH